MQFMTIQIQPMLRLNKLAQTNTVLRRNIQIQPMLRLNRGWKHWKTQCTNIQIQPMLRLNLISAVITIVSR